MNLLEACWGREVGKSLALTTDLESLADGRKRLKVIVKKIYYKKLKPILVSFIIA